MIRRSVILALLFALGTLGCAQGGASRGIDATVPPGVDSGTTDGAIPPVDGGPRDGGTDAGPPRPCSVTADCDDGLACNGTEYCEPEIGCMPGAPICDDGDPCTDDVCTEPGTCSAVPRDGDGDGAGDVACGGTDCNDARPDVHPGAAEACNGIDDDCSGSADDGAGMTCVAGSTSVSCTTACGTAGTGACTGCMVPDCRAAMETCGNGCDDDGDAMIDEGCAVPAPPNDLCAGAVMTSVTSGTTTGTLVGATAQTSDCGGEEVYYGITLGERSILYADTFGTGFDTRIAYRGTSCAGAASTCVDDACASTQSQLAVVVSAGTHFISVHADAGATPGAFDLRWMAVPAAGGDNVRITSSGSYTGSTSGTGIRSASCGGSATSPEDAFWFTLCPGESRSIDADTCDVDYYDTVLHARDASTELDCDDDSCGFDFYQSEIFFSASGPGVWAIYVDGYGSSNYGSYSLYVSGL